MLYCLAGLALLLLQRPSIPPSAVVQVAVHYGPQKDTLLSGVVVGDGRQVLTDTGVLPQAAEIVVAFTDGEVFDVLLKQARSQERIAVLPLAQKRAAPLPLSPIPVPDEGLNAVAVGAPRSFELTYSKVQLKPFAAGRWQVSPALPAFFRGGALLDPHERLLGILIQETAGGPLVGIPISAALAATLPVTVPPAVAEEKREAAPVAKAEAPPRRAAPPPEPPAPSLARLALPVPSPALGWIWSGARPPDPKPEPVPAVEVAAAPPSALFVPRPAVANPALDSVARGNELIKARDYDGAVKVLEDACKQFPDQAQLQYHLGFAYWYKAAFKKDGTLRKTMERTPYRKAREAFETFVKQAPNDPRVADAKVRLDILRRAQFGYGRE